MGSTPNFGDDRQRVLDATDIVALVGEHVQLKPKGREYVCVCPFHDDHKPSMYVVPHKQIYHCFSCGAGGNALDFAINYFKMDFREALKHLAERSGVELSPPPSRAGHAGQPVEHQQGGGASRADLFHAAAFAHDFFRAILRHPEHGKAARDAIQRRGVSPEMVEAFAMGAAPDRWDGLEQTIRAKSMNPAPFAALGLLKQRERAQGAYDAMRHRLIFPIHDQVGRVIGFGGRKLRDEDEPKYLNSPESPLFDKGRTLFGLHLARKAIQRENLAIVTEGYTDVIACHQAGVANTVATLGTALTRDHARLLQRLCDRVVLLFDGDEAGQKAADRAIEVFFAAPIDVQIAVLPGGADPDDLLKQEGGVQRFQACIAQATDALEYRFVRLAAKAKTHGMSGRVRLVQDDMGRLVELGLDKVDPIRRRLVVRRLAQIAGVSEREILDAMPAHARPRAGDIGGSQPRQRRERLGPQEHALGALLCDGSLWTALDHHEQALIRDAEYTSRSFAEVAHALLDLLDRGATVTPALLASAIERPEARQAVAELAAMVDAVTENDRARLLGHLRDSVRRIELAKSHEAPAPATLAPTNPLAQRINGLRETHRRFGSTPLAMPRPDATRVAAAPPEH